MTNEEIDRRNADTMLLDSVLGGHFATFYGIDWGRKDYTVANCPRCHEVHRWRCGKQRNHAY